MNWSRIGLDRWVASQYLERIDAPVEGALAVPVFSQNDPRWKNVRLGTSGTTIGWNGCLIDCIAMILRFYGYDYDPATLNAYLTANGGYANGNLLYWGKVPHLQIAAWHDCMDIPAPLSRIDAELALGRPCVVHVDFYPSTNPIDEHYVLIIGKLADEDYVFIDSWDGFVGSFKSRYVNPNRYIFRIVSYKKAAIYSASTCPAICNHSMEA